MISILPFLSTSAPHRPPSVPGGGEAFALLMADKGGRQAIAADGAILPETDGRAEPTPQPSPPAEPRIVAKVREARKHAALPFEREPAADGEVEPETSDEPVSASPEPVAVAPVEVAPRLPIAFAAILAADAAPLDMPLPARTAPVAAAPVPRTGPSTVEPAAAPVPEKAGIAPAQASAPEVGPRPGLIPVEARSRAEPARETALPSPARVGPQAGPSSTVAVFRPELVVAAAPPSPAKAEIVSARARPSAPARDVPSAPVAREGRPTPEQVASKPPRAALAVPVAAPRPLASGPAARVFASDIRRAARESAVPAVAPGAPAPAPAPAPLEPGLRPAEPATPVDTTGQRWPHEMVARIERLRDDADAADTSIRLAPDALGGVEVTLRREGDAVHVRFTAEEAATRALLHEAAPRLAEAAEARGFKLGQMGVGGGGGGGADAQGRPPQQQPAAAPVPARPPRPTAGRDDDAASRIA